MSFKPKVLAVTEGGTGMPTLTENNVLLGNGTSSPNFVAPGSSGNVLTSNGTTWVSASPSSAQINAWVNFNGNGSTSIRKSFNVSSITKNGTGDYTINFAVAVADANFSWNTGSANNSGAMFWVSATSSSVRLNNVNTSFSNVDGANLSVQIVD